MPIRFNQLLIPAALVMAACTSTRPIDAADEAIAPGPGESQLHDGLYVICGGAYAHRESLLIREGTFQHFLQGHSREVRRSSGTFTVVGDTILLNILEPPPVPGNVRSRNTAGYDFIIGDYAGLPVVWRGAEAAARSATSPRGWSDYAALFYTGADSVRRPVLSCGEIRARLAGGRPK